MPHTVFPKGVTATSTTSVGVRTVDGEVYADTMQVGGALTVGGLFSVGTSNNGVVGQVVAVPVFFGTASTAQIVAAGVPFTGQIIGAFVTIGSVSAVAAGYTVQVGSAGSVAVATVSNTITDSYANESLTTTKTSVTTANGIKCTRAAQGTAGDTTLTLLLQRTA